MVTFWREARGKWGRCRAGSGADHFGRPRCRRRVSRLSRSRVRRRRDQTSISRGGDERAVQGDAGDDRALVLDVGVTTLAERGGWVG